MLTYQALNSGDKMKSTYITITEKYTGEKKTFYVNVYPYATNIQITNKNQAFKVGSTYKLNAQTGPYNFVGKAGFGSVTWVSSEPDVATVDNKGNVKVKAYGQARITVTYKAGDVVKRDNVEIKNIDKNILNVAERIHSYMEQNKYSYSTGTLAKSFAQSKEYKTVTAPTYVSWVLQECEYINDSEHFDDCGTEENILLKHGWKKIEGKESNLKPGDIIIYFNGTQRMHTDIYAGNGRKLNAGGDWSIRSTHYDTFRGLDNGKYTKYYIYRQIKSIAKNKN